MSDTNARGAAVHPNPLINEVVADAPAAALSKAAFVAILDCRKRLLFHLTRETAASSDEVDA